MSVSEPPITGFHGGGGQWSERIVSSSIAERAVSGGHATKAELEQISAAWREWAAHEDGWFSIQHGEVRCHG